MAFLYFSAYAQDDLQNITRFIATDSPKRAQSFVAELRKQCDLIARFPSIGVAKDEYADGLRMLPHEKYLIFFSINEQGVLIERVLHSARNIKEALNQS